MHSKKHFASRLVWSPFALFFVLALLLPRGLGSAPVKPPKESPEGANEKSRDKDKKKTGDPKTTSPDPDAAFVKENLKNLLAPTSFKFLDDGRVTMQFDFGLKAEEHQEIFNIRIGKRMEDKFRWTIRNEEWVIGGRPGLRVSNSGLAVLKAWFKDDVEAEMEFLQYVNHEAKHIAAVVFTNGKGSALGSNYGGQCALFSRGRIAQARGTNIPVSFSTTARIKLIVRSGTFEAYRDGKKRAASKYKKKSYACGQIGILWGGSISGIIGKLEITGHLDNARMAKEIRKSSKK